MLLSFLYNSYLINYHAHIVGCRGYPKVDQNAVIVPSNCIDH